MTDDQIRSPLLDRLYQRYLNDEDSARFIQSVSERYTIGSLKRLCRFGQINSRRSATLALGFLGDFAVNESMGRSLQDDDRGVRLLADHGIRQIWTRQGAPALQAGVRRLYRLVIQNRLEDAIEDATRLIAYDPTLGEAWNQRAIAFCALGEFEAAAEDCRETLNCNRYHFPAAMGMGHCMLQMDDAVSALECFRLALSINPDLEGVRNHIFQIERTLEGS
ncbi:MAG: tetratricopeptide repeat protein [Planctomycetota bacterium]